jgi:Rha family phage regulatory protein
MSTDLVSIAGVSFINTNNGFYVSSREVADKFGKNHRDIVRVISTAEQSIISANNEDFNVRNFTRVGYIDAKGENRTEILMTRDGFAFIALSLTGQAAVEWKLRDGSFLSRCARWIPAAC